MSASEIPRERASLDGLTVGERLKQVRGEVSQDTFAQRLGVSRKTLIRYESGERLPDMDFMLALHSKLQIPPMWLMTGAADSLSGAMTKNEKFLIDTYRNLDDSTKKAVLTIFMRFSELAFIGSQHSEPDKKK